MNFLLGRMTASVACYVPLLDRLTRTDADASMRDEALTVLASILADPDWDADGVPEASALVHLTDRALIPQDRPWLAALYFATGRSLYFTSRDPAAIAVFDEALRRWPTPDHGTPLAGACRRHRARPTTLPGEDGSERLATDVICARRGF